MRGRLASVALRELALQVSELAQPMEQATVEELPALQGHQV